LIKRVSKNELKLRNTVKDLYQNSKHTYKVLENKGYDVDIAIPEFKVVLEYDGWYHFDTEEHKEYHKKRQKEIEKEGWRFIRYNIFQEFPTKEQIRLDIEHLIKEERNAI
jgi:very-short-patch-repair endonuclease